MVKDAARMKLSAAKVLVGLVPGAGPPLAGLMELRTQMYIFSQVRVLYLSFLPEKHSLILLQRMISHEARIRRSSAQGSLLV
jgi:hypothetical protein